MSAGAQFTPATLRPVGYHPSNIAYFNTPYLANALQQGGEWYSFTNSEFGTPVNYSALPAQFVNGYPQFLMPGQRLRGLLFGLNINNSNRPAAWPARDALAKGRLVVTWKGNADIRLHPNATFVASGSSGAPTGSLVDGKRIYLTGPFDSSSIEIFAIDAATPLTAISVFLPTPDVPGTPEKENELSSLEGHFFHPLFLQRLADRDWGFIRFMDWGATNASPQRDWIDRRLPAHAFATGIINTRRPSATADGNRETGIAYEHMIALCNLTGRNLWINVPHLATADYITRLAQLIRFGSDGVTPYTGVHPDPVFPPLDPALKVYVEFSNEIWSSGFSFPQGNWAEEQAAPLGLSKAQFNARKFADTWKIFQDVFANDAAARVIRVAAIFTALDGYSRPFMQEIATYGATLTPPVKPDVMALTTYFGNGIQDFVHAQGFTTGKLFNDPYWTSPLFDTHRQIALTEWTRRMLSGESSSGSGPDATNLGGGFPASLRTLPNETGNGTLPLIAYEGGPSLYTNELNEGVTTFVEAMNRDPRIAEVYRIHLDIARSKGLWTHTPYTDTSTWSRFGQWGHLETLDQMPADSPKYSLMLEHADTFTTLRHIDAPHGTVPQFDTAAILPAGLAGQPYTADISTSGGTAPRVATVIGSFLDGMSITSPSAGTIRISGTPTISRKHYIFVRVHDADNDPAWRLFTLEVFGGPGTLVQSDFRGTNPAQARPWTPAFVLSPLVTWTGWNIGAGIVPQAGHDAFFYSVSAGAAAETLTTAIADQQYLTATVAPAPGQPALDLRNAEIRFAMKRVNFHAPRSYAVFTSIGGFAEANTLSDSALVDADDFADVEYIVKIPGTAPFQTIASPMELRIYAAGARFDGHVTSLTSFKLTQDVLQTVPAAPANLSATAISTTQVELTWNPVPGVSGYQVYRKVGGSDLVLIGSPVAAAFSDSSATASTANVYQVHAVAPGGTSSASSPALATTIVFLDDPAIAGSTIVRGSHLDQLRVAVAAVRATAALPPQNLTDPTITAGVTVLRAAHIAELRSGLIAALTALGLPLPVFTNTVSAGSLVRAVDVQELRAAVK